jgi:putative serine protease PepD
MTTTYDPFIPADGTDQHRYDGRRRAEGRAEDSGWSGGERSAPEPRWVEPPQQRAPHQQRAPQQWAEPEPAWQPEERWERDQHWEPEPSHQPEQRWDPEPARPPRWQPDLTNSFPVALEPEPERGRRDRTSRAKAKPVLIGMVGVLVAVAAWQAYRIERMNSDNAAMHSTLVAEKGRTDRLEKELAGVFDPEAVSSKVLPSVFRVRAGDFTGTAFSVGRKANDGESNLFTNYHVVAEVWTDGGRTVSLERGNTKIKATIVKVSKGKDLALLKANQDIAGLSTATSQVKPGQQVVVVGAPLGLDDTVTTGVISAWRPDDPDGPTIQFDAPINPGNSGGPVVNSGNQVVGLATAKAKDAEGIGLAIPIKTACETFDVC